MTSTLIRGITNGIISCLSTFYIESQVRDYRHIRLCIHQVITDDSLSVNQILENAPSAPRLSGNLSALKKRWEQPPVNPTIYPHKRLSGHTTISHQPKKATATPLSSEPVQVSTTTNESQALPADSQAAPVIEQGFQDLQHQEKSAMENQEQEALESASVPSMAIEKSNVPLTSLKMMFEKGENMQNKVSYSFLSL